MRTEKSRWMVDKAVYGTIVDKEFKDNVNVNNDQM